MVEPSHFLILFGDLVGSTEVAVEASPHFFARNYIASFHWAAHKALQFVKQCEVFEEGNFKKKIDRIDIAGDEVHAFVPLDLSWPQAELQDLIASTIDFAYITKLYWLVAPYNVQRMLRYQFPRDISVGIHIGQAARVQTSTTSDVAGLHINMTKRIESNARDARESRIFASRDVTEIFEGWRRRISLISQESRPPLSLTRFYSRPPISGKGVPKKMEVLELGQEQRSLSEIMFLVRQLETTPERPDVKAEIAAKLLAEIFLPVNEPLFLDKVQDLSVEHELGNITTVSQYIEKWFEAIHKLPKIFLDEPWLLFDSFFVSCALIRHSSVEADKRERYKTIGNDLFVRLGHLLEQNGRRN